MGCLWILHNFAHQGGKWHYFDAQKLIQKVDIQLLYKVVKKALSRHYNDIALFTVNALCSPVLSGRL